MQEKMYPGEMTDENIQRIFGNAADLNVRRLHCAGRTIYTYAIDGLTSGNAISEYVIKPLMEQLTGTDMAQLYQKALDAVVVNSVAKPCEDLEQVAMLLVNGFCVVLFPGAGAIALETKTGEKRNPAPPEVEHTSKGPKDAFVETVRTNTSLVRRHLRTPELRIFETTVGARTLTNVSVVWIQGITDPELVDRMKRRLASIRVDGFLTPAAVEEYITGSRATAFPLLQYTERTDRFCHGLLKGRIGILVDGIPIGYLAPVDLGYLMNSPEDYGRDYITASWVRILRYGALFLGLLLPAVFIALTVFHRHWLPDGFLAILAESRERLPYSAAWEILALLVAFELLQESGIHLPQSIGQSVSIVGGIVVGSAAVEAGLIAPMALIVVSIAGICGFVIPNRDLAGAIRLWRFILAALASLGGIWLTALGFAFLAWHLGRLKSLGVPYIILFAPTLMRKPLKSDKFRDRRLDPQDRKRQE